MLGVSPTCAMDGHEYPRRHFRDMEGIAGALQSLPAQICSHLYSYESFGSWWTIVLCKGVRLRIVFDGRDCEYRLERSTSRQSPEEWCETGWRRTADSDAGPPVVEIARAVVESAR